MPPILLIVASQMVLAQDPLVEVIPRIKPAVVGIGSFDPMRNPRSDLRGTGFVVGDGREVVTNAHVLPKIDKRKGTERLAVFTGSGANIRPRVAEVVVIDKSRDLAVLRLNGGPLPALELARSDRIVREGTRIAFTGFPIGMAFGLHPATHTGIVAALTPSAVPALNSRQLKTETVRAMRSAFIAMQLDATAYPGNSGSPVYLPETGEVVGVLNSVIVKRGRESALKDPSGISYAIPVSLVRDLLRRARAKTQR